MSKADSPNTTSPSTRSARARSGARRAGRSRPKNCFGTPSQTAGAIFDWSNDEWALTWLPHLRAATYFLNAPDKLANETDLLLRLMEAWTVAKLHLLALAEALDDAVARGLLIVDPEGEDLTSVAAIDRRPVAGPDPMVSLTVASRPGEAP
jgi:hypothetical protein